MGSEKPDGHLDRLRSSALEAAGAYLDAGGDLPALMAEITARADIGRSVGRPPEVSGPQVAEEIQARVGRAASPEPASDAAERAEAERALLAQIAAFRQKLAGFERSAKDIGDWFWVAVRSEVENSLAMADRCEQNAGSMNLKKLRDTRLTSVFEIDLRMASVYAFRDNPDRYNPTDEAKLEIFFRDFLGVELLGPTRLKGKYCGYESARYHDPAQCLDPELIDRVKIDPKHLRGASATVLEVLNWGFRAIASRQVLLSAQVESGPISL